MKSQVNCPICEYEDCDEFIIDLFICNSCSHIFKEIPNDDKKIPIEHIHRLVSPIKRVREAVDSKEIIDTAMFIMPSMNFYTLDLEPSRFYKSFINHYFNQKSMMILLKRTGLVPITQNNNWDGKICETTLYCKVDR